MISEIHSWEHRLEKDIPFLQLCAWINLRIWIRIVEFGKIEELELSYT